MVIVVEETMIRDSSWWRRRTKFERRLLRTSLIFTFISVALVIAIFVILTKREQKSNKNTLNSFCATPACISAASDLLNDMDTTVRPCDDFYRFSCGGFIDKHHIPDEDALIDFFTINEDKIYDQLKVIVEDPGSRDDPEPFTIAKNMYKMCLNLDSTTNNDVHRLKSIINSLGGWPVVMEKRWNESAFDWLEATYVLRRLGVPTEYFINFDVQVDEKNTSRRIIVLDQADFGLHEAYLVEGFYDDVVQAYYDYMVDIAVEFGAQRHTARIGMQKNVKFEIKLAEASLTYEELRDLNGLYNIMNISELQLAFPEIPWLLYINNILGVSDIEVSEDEMVVVRVPRFINQTLQLLGKTPKRILANYIIWRTVAFSLPYLTGSLRTRKSEFEQKMEGSKAVIPRWKECLTQVIDNMEIATSALYVRKHAAKLQKKNVYDIISNIKGEFINLIKEVDWMDESTRSHALEKAKLIIPHVAYPEEMLDDKKIEDFFSNLVVSKESYLELVLKISLFYYQHFFSLLRKPFNKTDWTIRNTLTEVDALYNLEQNSMELTVGIVQGVFYDSERPNYMNYGGVGFLIGHEITHGFDNEGSEYDKDGNLNNWWADGTRKVFLKKAECIRNQYANYTISEINTQINGVNTQEENIADNGGVRAAYLAYKRWNERNGPDLQLPGFNFTPQQMFWISTAHSWCAKYRNEYLKVEVATDRHSPSPFRILGSFGNSEHFSEDFNCPKGSNMNPEVKCRVW